MTLASSHPVRIQIGGPLAVERDGQRLESGLPGRQGRLLFTYLVVNRHRHIPRDELAEALWREPDPAPVDARLNPLLSKLRRVFGADAVDGRSTLRLCLRDAWVDLEAVVDAIHRAESAVALQDCRGRGDRRLPRFSWPSGTSSPARTRPGSIRPGIS